MAKKKNQKYGFVDMNFADLSCLEMKDMNFWDQFIPENSEVVKVRFYHEYGVYEEPDEAVVSIEWKMKEE